MSTAPRVIISTDIGGSDPDDFQSLVHYLVYSDRFETEGLISSPWGGGRARHILEVIDRYEADYPNLLAHSRSYPHPDELRRVTKQGATGRAPLRGYATPTEGSRWIAACALRPDPRPLYVLIWGAIDDLAQALHDEPSISERLRVYYIGGPNKKWGPDAYEYIRRHHPSLWMIENNSTYRGWFVGGEQRDDLGNESFVARHVKGHGALGDYFADHLNGVMKMGDTPSVAYLLHGCPDDPAGSSWGGSFARVKSRPKAAFSRVTTADDRVELFAVVELIFPGPFVEGGLDDAPRFSLIVEGQAFEGYYRGNGLYCVRYVPKAEGVWSYTTVSEVNALDGLTGAFTCVAEDTRHLGFDPDAYPNWWSDRLDPESKEGPHSGAKTVSRWREAFLRDFAARMDRCLGV